MPDTIVIRAAQSGDETIIFEMICELAAFEKLAHEVVADARSLGRYLFGSKPRAQALVAEVNGQIAGFALYFYNFSTFLGKPGLYLEDLFVRPQFRGHQLGTAILKKLASIAVEEGCGRFEWWVLDWNEPAIKFYKKIGARPMDEWTVYRVDGEPLKALASSSE